MREFLHRFTGAVAPFVAATLIAGSLLVSTAASAQAGVAAPAKSSSCSLTKVGEKLGPTYVEKLTVTNVSCTTADSLVHAYNNCRLKHGGVKGKCPSKVDGYKCVEQRYTGSPDGFIAKVACTKSRDAVDFTYSEEFG